jgi:hypothetical protein
VARLIDSGAIHIIMARSLPVISRRGSCQPDYLSCAATVLPSEHIITSTKIIPDERFTG